MSRWVRISLGITAIIVGLAGLVLPFLQGWLFLALGALLLSVEIPVFDRVLVWIVKKFPALEGPVTRLRDYLKGPPGQKR